MSRKAVVMRNPLYKMFANIVKDVSDTSTKSASAQR